MSAEADFREPTDERFATEREQTTLRPWYDAETGFSQEPFLAAPEGFASPVTVPDHVHYHGFVSGVGAGKTTAGIIRTLANAEQWNPGDTGMIVAPTVPHVKNVILPEMRKWGVLDHAEYHGKGSDEPGLHFPSGTRVILESADNARKIERLRGPSISFFWIDEAAHLPATVWDVLVGRLRTGNYRNGYITTTPKGKNWVYDRFYTHEGENGQTLEGPPADVNLVYGVPSTANPELPDDYADITEEFTGTERDQEVRGLFVQPEGLVYSEFDPVAQVVAEPPSNPGRVLYGVDWGYRNPSAIVALIETRTDELVVVEEFYENRVTTGDLADVALELQGRWGAGTFYCDPAEPDSIEEFQRAGLDAIGADNDILSGISAVSGNLDRLYVRETCQNVINEFGAYRYPDETASDSDPGEKPVDANNHALDAVRYAIATGLHDGLNVGVAAGGDLYEP